MIFKLTTIGCNVSDESYERITRHLAKIEQALPNMAEDLIVFRVNLKKNIDKYHPPKTHPHTHKSYADARGELAYFEGSITFRIHKKQLYVHFKGQTIDESIDTGFKLIFKELEKYKDLHFPSESEYPRH